MRVSDATLRATLYNANVMVQADLVEVTLAIGTQRWTTAAQDIVVGGATYYSGRPVIEHGSIRGTAASGEIATCDLRLQGTYQISGISVSGRARAGDFDNVDVALRRVFMTNWQATPSMALDVFTGRVADVVFDSYSVELRLKSILYKTEEQRPLRVIQSACPWILYGTECGANQASFSANDTVDSGSTALAVKLTTGTSYATPGGTILFTSGNLNGVTAVIRSYVAGTRIATLVSQLSVAPAQNDGLTVSRGCDRTLATCKSPFNRAVAFGGFPAAPRKTP